MTQSTNRHSPLKRFFTNRRVWAVFILLVGLCLMLFFGTRTLRAYREFEYARGQGLLDGTASVDAIQPWMTIRYIAVAYAVPEEYIYARLGIPFDRRAEHDPLGRLARQHQPDQSATDGASPPIPPPAPEADRAALLTQMRAIILAYHENPVAPGLRDIRPWMSLAYIANSTGMPVDDLVAELQVTAQSMIATEDAAHGKPPVANPSKPNPLDAVDTEENRYKPLEQLSNDLHYPGGLERLLDAVRAVLANFDKESVQESP